MMMFNRFAFDHPAFLAAFIYSALLELRIAGLLPGVDFARAVKEFDAIFSSNLRHQPLAQRWFFQLQKRFLLPYLFLHALIYWKPAVYYQGENLRRPWRTLEEFLKDWFDLVRPEELPASYFRIVASHVRLFVS